MSIRICYSPYFPSIFLFCITMMQATIFVSSTSAFQDTDRVALYAFKSMISDDSKGILNSWNDSRHFCAWEGVLCSRGKRRVSALRLNSRGLIGSLSPYIGNLSFLREIHLSNNNIRGEIPREFGRLLRLEYLSLSDNSLVGEIPANLSYCYKLTRIFLRRNKLIGNIPIEFVSLYNLKILAIGRNNLTGNLPHFLGNLSSLEKISLRDNAFEGNIPDSFGRLKNLNTLRLAANNLSGTIPLSIYNLSSLTNFSVNGNRLHGSLPPSLGHTLSNLRHFQISYNFFSGSIPTSFSNASKLKVIEMTRNNFSGKLSVDFRGIKHLRSLTVAFNNLGSGEDDEMSFMNSLVNCSNLRILSVGRNHFRGALSHSIVNLSSQLQYLVIGSNQIYGSIPSEITNLFNLEYVTMSDNQITGTIPNEMGKFPNLRRLSLGRNNLLGKIPSSLGNLSTLEKLYLANNKLSGAIPSSLGKLKKLTILDLSQNDLNGIIPKEIFNIESLSIGLHLSQNHLVGSIPQNIGNLKVISVLDVSDNNLSDEIPSEIGLCSDLEGLYMGGNFFLGSIPPSLNSMKGIRYIDLSRNNLFGQIPKFLETLPLQNLNLSFNHFEGAVPTKGIFANASAVSVAGNRNRLCGGVAELRLPHCTNNNSKKQKVSRVLKIVISTASGISGLVFLFFFIFCWLKIRKAKKILRSRSKQENTLSIVSYGSLLKATNGFSSAHLLGVGSFGSVYKGILEDLGAIVAVKVLNLQRQGASRSFMAECKVLRNIRHRNLVKIITCCSSIDFQGNEFKALVYEYMPNGSLEKWIHPALQAENEELEIQGLPLLQRLNIGIDVASAIDYLHHHCQEPILHCDLKPSNVLLDNDMNAHVGDFGLARFRPQASNPKQSSSVGVRGTIGYAAPEYGLGSEVSTNGDIYSYGILLLEMVTRKKPTDLMFEGNLNLHKYARMALPDRLMDIVDPMLLNDDLDSTPTPTQIMSQAENNSRMECLISLVRIGVSCSMESPQDRMNITDVVRELQSARKILLEHENSERGQRG